MKPNGRMESSKGQSVEGQPSGHSSLTTVCRVAQMLTLTRGQQGHLGLDLPGLSSEQLSLLSQWLYCSTQHFHISKKKYSSERTTDELKPA